MLIALLKYSLFDGPQPLLNLKLADWKKLLHDAQKQGVVAMIYDAIQQLPEEYRPPKSVLFHFASLTETIEHENQRREKALCDFAQLIQEELSLHTVVVKGSSLARLYPQPLHRECGDNDLYMGDNAIIVDDFLISKGVNVDQKDPRHSSFQFDGIPFENHYYLLYNGRDIQWKSVVMEELNTSNVRQIALNDEKAWLKNASDKTSIRRLIPEQEALFVAAHIEHHAVFFNEPIFLRKLVDWALLLANGSVDYSELNKIKKGTDIDAFVDLLTQYCISIFDITPPQCWHPLSNAALKAFEPIYINEQKRHKLAVVRVLRRSFKYIRYANIYKEIYGQSPFKRFYINNIKQATIQLLKGQPRQVRQ